MDGYNHYLRANEAGTIVYGFSSAFEQPADNDILLLEDGPRHFQEAFSESLTDGQGVYIYKWDGSKIVERTAEELAADATEPTTTLTPEQQRLIDLELTMADLIAGGGL
ncbi:hypothetical protein SAMN04487969_101138 [Paenibacillus algorifonticola]|uniref:Uncharacterized protein n=1 Tax=Paenibacillus algorifonticola TaxID=684063 RepID=A0A1I1XW96_9BACL|nr:hypothetical protein [Paenibacillus algorifonticola]SFE11635.1 hypothetical protein SAMN04487969_101138 [Paenibacillus algorifonticola]